MMVLIVSVVEVVNMQVSDWDEFSGWFSVFEFVMLMLCVFGYVNCIYFKEGVLVKVGDVLFEIDFVFFEVEVVRL